MKTNILWPIRLFLLGCIIPVVLSSVVYEGFSSNYTAQVFSKSGFEHYYGTGIYKYRILSPAMLIKTYEFIKHYDLPTMEPHSLTLMDRDGDPQFYSAYFYMNTFFLCLTCVLLLIILGAQHKDVDFIMVDLPVLFICALMTITQYAVVPYDTLSYFFFSLAALLILGKHESLVKSLALYGIVVVATLIRETSVFILVFYLAVNYKMILRTPNFFKLGQNQKEFTFMTACFAGTYIGLRLVLGYEHAVYQTFLLSRNMNFSYSLLGVLFFASIAFLVVSTTIVTKEISLFLVVSLPYVVFVFLFADPWEIRLWIPILLPLMILKVKASQTMNTQAFVS